VEFGFLLKKIISIFIMPLPIFVLIGLLGLIFLYKNSIKKAKIFLSVSLLGIIIISSKPFASVLLVPLESQYQSLKVIPNDVKHILLLGGDKHNRAWEALRLYNLIPNSKIITSGYSFKGNTPEAVLTAKLLIASGVKKEDIIIHSMPKDTLEEALYVKKVLKDKKFILITSAYHMSRSIATFNSVGLYPIASATNYLIKPKEGGLEAISGNNILQTELAWHEYIGLLWNKIKN